MVGAAVVILAESSAKLAHDHHGAVPPRRAHLLGECRKPHTQFIKTIGQVAGGCALVDMVAAYRLSNSMNGE